MTKRILALVLVAVFALTSTLLVACGETTTEDKAPASSPAQGGESSKADEPSTPVEPSTPATPDVPTPTPTPTPSESKTEEPEEKFSTAWIEWLTEEDYGDTYPMAWQGSLYDICNYDKDSMDASCWELWPYTDKKAEDNTHFHACICISSAEFDGFTNLGTEEYEYTWKVFYRVDGSDDDYASFEGAPWGAITHGDNYLYRFAMCDYGAKFELAEDGSTQTYHVVMVILNKEGEIVIWRDELMDWTNSSQAFYEDGIELGLIKTQG